MWRMLDVDVGRARFILGVSWQVSMALVPFSFVNPFHDALRDEKRFFPIAGRQVTIEQGWKNDGKGGTSIGFGASVYDAAICLSLHLELHPHLIKNKRVLELGCGPGLVGITAACLDASYVALTDGDPASVALTQRNVEINQLDQERFQAHKYLWGSGNSYIEAPEKPFDVILGADIVACPYADAFDALLQSLRVLTAPHTVLLLAYKRRHGSETTFFDALAAEFDVQQVKTTELHPDFQQQSEIVVFQVQRKGTR